MKAEARIELVHRLLSETLNPVTLEIVDESHKHAGHAGAKSGGGHFVIRIESDAFIGKRLIERHRMVYAALGDAMNSDVHAVSITAVVPGEG